MTCACRLCTACSVHQELAEACSEGVCIAEKLFCPVDRFWKGQLCDPSFALSCWWEFGETALVCWKARHETNSKLWLVSQMMIVNLSICNLGPSQPQCNPSLRYLVFSMAVTCM